MLRSTQIAIPTLVRIKPGALERIGVYARRGDYARTVLFCTQDLSAELSRRLVKALINEDVQVLKVIEVGAASFDQANAIFHDLPAKTDLLIGFGGGRALDVAKYVAFLSRLPYIAVPTALSNDAFCSPQASLEGKGIKKSYPATMPYGVVVDTDVTRQAPEVLWLSGVGDLVSKFTAIYDWKLASKREGGQINDFAALLSDSTVFQFIAHSTRDLDGMRLLAIALMLNGIAMGVCGSSRPASGSEHLISHALDTVSRKPRLHGLQVGIATYLVSQLQEGVKTDRIRALFDAVGFWKAFQGDPLIREEWEKAFQIAPFMKGDFYTVLSEGDRTAELLQIMDTDPRLKDIVQ
ncbi:MAG: iron-containing alcohol dehydrogenase family protein [Candidatus Omnitrophota bacterium]